MPDFLSSKRELAAPFSANFRNITAHPPTTRVAAGLFTFAPTTCSVSTRTIREKISAEAPADRLADLLWISAKGSRDHIREPAIESGQPLGANRLAAAALEGLPKQFGH